MPKPRKERGLFERPPGSGIWWIEWYTADRKRRRKKIGAKRLAKQALEQIRARVALEKVAPELVQEREVVLLEDALEHHVATSENTPNMKREERRYQRQWNEWFPGARLRDIRPSDLERWRTKRSKEVKAATVNRALSFLRRTYNIAVREGWVLSNPVSKIRFLREDSKKDRFFTEVEAARMEAHYPRPDWLRIEFALQTGMRKAEQFGLTRSDLNLDLGYARLPETKGGEAQMVELNSRAVEIIREMLASHDSEYVFPNSQGGWQDGGNYTNRVFVPGLRELGITGANWHTLRHTFCSWLAIEGVSLRTIQQLARHKSYETTERYAHLSPDHKRAAVERLSTKTSQTPAQPPPNSENGKP